MARETILLTRQDIEQGFKPQVAVSAIEQAMARFEDGNDYLPPKAIFEIPVEGAGAWAACITGYTETTNLLSMKLGQERTDNAARNLPTTHSWLPVFEPVTGELLMICDGTLPTMLRTAAAAAVAVKHLARPDATTLAVVGAGQLGRQCARLASTVRRFKRILICDLVESAAESLSEELAEHVEAPVEPADAESACTAADVIVTATNSRQPIIRTSWVRPGTHLSCMGTDLPDKIECQMSLLPHCRIFADFAEHAVLRGEVSQAVQQGILNQDCYAGSLGQVINGDVAGRTTADEITMFDGVGIGIQDTTIAKTIYDQAVQRDLGIKLAFS